MTIGKASRLCKGLGKRARKACIRAKFNGRKRRKARRR